MIIDIINNQKIYKIDTAIKTLLKKCVKETLKGEKIVNPVAVSILITDNLEIQSLNREYRNKDSSTDVLSFPLIDSCDILFKSDKSEIIPLGDIAISIEKALSQAEEFGHTLETELVFLVTHGMLHLLQYDHEIDQENEKRMRQKEQEIMKKLKIYREDWTDDSK